MLYLSGEIIIFLLLAMVLGVLLGGYLRGSGWRMWRGELAGIRKRTHELEEGRQAMMEAGESLRTRLEMLEAQSVQFSQQFSQRLGDAESDLSALGAFKDLFQILNQAHAREISRVDALEARFRRVEDQLALVENIGPGFGERSVLSDAFGALPATARGESTLRARTLRALPSGEPTRDLAARLRALDAVSAELAARVDALSAQLVAVEDASVDDVFDEGTNVEGPSVGALVARMDMLSARLDGVAGVCAGEGECDVGPSVADLSARLDALSAQLGVEHLDELEGSSNA